MKQNRVAQIVMNKLGGTALLLGSKFNLLCQKLVKPALLCEGWNG